VSFRFQFRRGTAAERDAANPVLAAGEPAVVLDSGQPAELVLGDGVTAMADLRRAVWGDDARLAAAATATQPGDLAAEVATRAPGASSPRGTSRVLNERKPIAFIEQSFPNAAHDHAILWTEGNRVWAYGRDRTLRTSGNFGAQWEKLAHSGTNQYAKLGIFYKTTAGSFLTTSHPEAGGAPAIVRSNNSGLSFSTVIAAQTNVEYQGVTAIAQDLATGYLWAIEYVTTDAATVSTFKIVRSTDDGATWSTFKTINRSGAGAMRHGHGCQYDPVSQRMHFLIGDSEPSAGLYRVNAGGADIEPVITNATGQANGHGNVATSVGVMFFPDYIAWGMDATVDSWLIRLPRTQIGQAAPAYERVTRLQSTAFNCTRANTGGTEWLMSVSNQDDDVTATAVDRSIHLYRVADNGATCDEVLTFGTISTGANSTRWATCVGTPLQQNTDGLTWVSVVGEDTLDRIDATPTVLGRQFAIRLGWGVHSSHKQETRKPFYTVSSQSSGFQSLTAAETKVFGATRVPGRTRRLYIMDIGVAKVAGSGSVKVQVWNNNIDSLVTDAATGSALDFVFESARTNRNLEASSHVYTTGILTANNVLHFRLVETGGASAVDAVGYVTYAFGY